jgi:hypothetical protein
MWGRISPHDAHSTVAETAASGGRALGIEVDVR